MAIKIEKNIPIPRGKGHDQLYPWQDLNVGDSFLVPWSNTTGIHASATYYRSLNPGFVIKTKREGKNRRVWRIA